MDRRAALLAFAAVASGAGARAAEPGSRKRVGLFVTFGAAMEARVRSGAAALLAPHGFIEGRNLSLAIVDYADRMPERERLARELVATRPDVILVVGSGDALLFQRLTTEIPIVFAGVADPEGTGLVASLAHPGANITGASSRYAELLGKRLELLRALRPGMRRVAVIAASGSSARLLHESALAAAGQLGLDVTRIVMEDDSERSVEAMLAALAKARPEGVAYAGVRVMGFVAKLLAALRGAALPAVFADHLVVSMGGLMSLGEREEETYARAMGIAARILQGGQPGSLPVDQLARPHLAINLATARAMRLAIPDSIRLRADQVFE